MLCRVEKAADIRRQWTGEMLPSTETRSIKLPAKSRPELAEREQQGGSVGKRPTSEVAIAVDISVATQTQMLAGCNYIELQIYAVQSPLLACCHVHWLLVFWILSMAIL